MERNTVYLGDVCVGEIISYWADESEPDIAKLFFIKNNFTVTDFSIRTHTWMFWRNIYALAELEQIIAESKLFYYFFETNELGFPDYFSYTRKIICYGKNDNKWVLVYEDKTIEVESFKKFEEMYVTNNSD